MSFKNQLLGLLFLSHLIFSTQASVITAPQHHASDFPGEYIGLQTRKLALIYDDVVIAGNSGLDIVVTRRQAGDKVNFNPLKLVVSRQYSIESPIMNTTCLGEFNKLSVMYQGEHLVPAGFSDGTHLPSDMIAAFSNNAYVSCAGDNGSVPVLNLANGRKITLQVLSYTTHSAGHGTSYGIDTITDRHGNTIRYLYEDDIQTYMPKRLQQIIRDDGVTVNFVYDQSDEYFSYVKQINYLNATINYQYTDRKLTAVIDPQGRTSEFDYATYTGIGTQVHKIRLPNGLAVEYNHGALYDNGFRLPDNNGNFSLADFGYSGGSLNFKTITGPGLTTQRYTYQNMPDNRVLVTQFNYDGDKDLSTEYTFELATFSNLNGRVKQIRRFSGVLTNEGDPRDALTDHPLVYQQNFTYSAINNTHKCQEVTKIALQPLDCTRYLTATEVLVVGSDTFNKHYQQFNQFGQITQWQESHASHTRTHQLGFDHDLNQWILNQPTTVSVGASATSQTVVDDYQYYPKDHPDFPFYLYQHSQFGVWQKRFSDYHRHGEVKTIEFNQKLSFGDTSQNRYIRYENYHRGQPQQTFQPARVTAGEISNQQMFSDESFGYNRQVIDANGHITDYGFDHLGRPIYIDPHDSTMADSYISYQDGYTPTTPTTYSTINLERCQLTLERNACAATPLYSNTTWHNGYGKVILTKHTDGSQSLYRQSQFNSFGRQTYQGLPTFSQPDLNHTDNGIVTEYDALQRPVTITHQAGGTIHNSYLAGNKIQQTDAQGHITTYHYLAYGEPNYDTAIKIESPQQLTTTIDINLFGQISQITQTGFRSATAISQTEQRLYDAQQRLCMTKRLDVGNDYFQYNALGQITWQAQGVTGTDCQTHSASDAQKITYQYDNQGALQQLNYADNSPSKTYTHDNNGNITAIDTLDFKQTYQYNSNNQISQERLQLFADNIDWTFVYGYDSLSHLASIHYPNDPHPITYNPNYLGQPTQVLRAENSGTDTNANTTFIHQGVNYHPNNTIASYTYGNGIVHTTTLNDHQLPSQLLDQKQGQNSVLDLSYQYDYNHNITSIINPKAGGIYSLTNLQYDGLNRLISTQGGSAIGSSNIAYDSLGNILNYSNTSTSNPHNLSYQYDQNFRLSAVTGTGSQGYDFQPANQNSGDAHDSYNHKGAIIHNGKRSFNYNLANQMVTSNDNHYLYDGHNRRIKVTTPSQTSYSYYSHTGQLLLNKTAQGATQYIYLGTKLIAKESIDLTPSTNTQNHFKPFGQTIDPSQDDVGYTGHKFDVDLGLNYMQARYYDPVIGRFMSNDPVGWVPNSPVHSFGRYTYANNNPYKYTDPDGQFAFLAWLATPAGIAAMTKAAEITVLVTTATVAAIAGNEAINAYNESANSSSDDKDASTPTGSRDHPMDVEDGANEPTEIDGREYSGHALDRMQGRGVPPSAVEESIQNGQQGEGNTPGTTTHTDSTNGIKTITNDTGKVITVINVGRDK